MFNFLLLTKSSTFIIGPIASLLGYIMQGIFWFLDLINIPNIGFAIIIFTLIVNLLMMPLTIKQQKFSKLSAKMNPELQAVQAKYKGKKDTESSMAMQQETQAVYAKYGVSPTGSCLQLLIQMPILFSLYRVINNMPAYVPKIKDAFSPLVENFIAQAGSSELIKTFSNYKLYAKQFSNELFTSGNAEYIKNTFIDVLNKSSTSEWLSISEKFPSLSVNVTDTMNLLGKYNDFLGLNIANSPKYMLSEVMAKDVTFGFKILLIIGVLAIPALSAVTQWINVKLMPQAAAANSDASDTQNQMASTMKMMNNVMPIMSAVFCFSLPAGLGLYWVAGSVVRSIQQIAINKHMDKLDLDELIKKNVKKANKKREKRGLPPQALTTNARISTKTVVPSARIEKTPEEKDEALKKAAEYYKTASKNPGSIASKANMVKLYNEKNNNNK